MIHSMIQWLDEVNTDLWPFDIHYSVYLWNKINRGKAMISPEELFYDVRSDHQELHSSKVFGCHTYIFYPRIKYRKKIPRWINCKKMIKFLRSYDEHA